VGGLKRCNRPICHTNKVRPALEIWRKENNSTNRTRGAGRCALRSLEYSARVWECFGHGRAAAYL